MKIMNLKLYFSILFGTSAVMCSVSDEEYASLPPIFEFDNFDRCMLFGKKGLYCTIEFQLKPIEPNNPSIYWQQIKALSENPKNYHHDKLRHGICLPLTCPNITTRDESEFKKDLEKCYEKKYEDIGVNGSINHIFCQDGEPFPFDFYDQAVISFFIIYFLFIIYATVTDTCDNQQKTTLDKFINCFSFHNNLRRLKKTSESSENESLKCIQGVRVYMMTLVIMVHDMIGAVAAPISNTKLPEEFTDHPLSIVFTAGSNIIQIFFVISSWLLTYLVFEAFENKKELSFKHLVWIFVNRYVRLTAPLAVVLALHSTLILHAPKGPFWNHLVGQGYKQCRKNGWTNLLYINNYVNRYEMCMPHTWYLATDTQLFILTLLILAIMKKCRNKIKWILGICLIVGISIPAVLVYVNNYDIVLRSYPENIHDILRHDEQFHILYSAAYSNVGACVIGIIFGYLYYVYKDENLPSKLYIGFFYILSALPFVAIMVAYPMYNTSYNFSRTESAFCWSVVKNLIALGMAIAIFGMTKKFGGFVLKMCLWKSVQVLGRLSYSAYLLHVLVIWIKMSSIRSPVYVNIYMSILGSVEEVALIYLFAFVLCIAFEMPVSGLQKLLLPQKTSNTVKPVQGTEEVDKTSGKLSQENKKKL